MAKPKACSCKKLKAITSYSYALDGVDLKRGQHGLVVFRNTPLDELGKEFYNGWRTLTPTARSIYVQILSRYGLEAANNALIAYRQGWHRDPTFLQLLFDGASRTLHIFPATMKTYSNTSC